MEQSPLQLYSSSLLFSPEKFRSSLSQEDPGWPPDLIRIATMIEEDWTTWSLAFEGHSKLHGYRGRIKTLEFSDSGSFIVSSDNFGTILVWNAQNGATIARLHAMKNHLRFGAHRGFALSRTDLVAYCGPDQEGLEIWDVRQNKHMTRLPGSEKANLPIVFAPDGLTIASVFSGTKVRVWGVWEKDHVQTLPERPEAKPIALTFNPDGRYLVVGYSDGVLSVHDKNNMWAGHRSLQSPESHGPNTLRLTWANDLLISTLYFGDNEKLCALLWNIEHAELLKTITGRGSPWSRSVYLPALDSVITGPLRIVGSNPTVEIWPLIETASAQLSRGVFDGIQEIELTALSSDGNLLAGLTRTWGTRLWDIQTGKLCSILGRDFDLVPGAEDIFALSPSARACAVGGRDGVVRLWDPRAQPSETQERLDLMKVYDVATKRHLAACATTGGEVHICEIEIMRSVVQLPLPQGTRIDNIRFSSSEAFLIVRYRSQKVWTTDVYELVPTEGESLAAKKAFAKEWHPDRHDHFECSPSGRLWGQVTQKECPQMIEVFDIQTAETLAVYEFPRPVLDMKVVALSDSTPNSPALCVVAVRLDQKKLVPRTPAEASQDPPSAVALFVLEYHESEMSMTRREVLVLPGSHSTDETGVAFLPAENMIVSSYGTNDGTTHLRMWDLMNFEPLGRRCLVPRFYCKMKICDRGLCLCSDLGNFAFRHDSQESFRKCGCGHVPVHWLEKSPQWLMWADQPFFWLPPDQRAIRYVFIVKNTVVIQLEKGKLPLSITFDREKVEGALGF